MKIKNPKHDPADAAMVDGVLDFLDETKDLRKSTRAQRRAILLAGFARLKEKMYPPTPLGAMVRLKISKADLAKQRRVAKHGDPSYLNGTHVIEIDQWSPAIPAAARAKVPVVLAMKFQTFGPAHSGLQGSLEFAESLYDERRAAAALQVAYVAFVKAYCR